MNFEPLGIVKGAWVAEVCKGEFVIARVLVYRLKLVWFFEIHDWRTHPKTIQKYDVDLPTDAKLDDVFKTVQEAVENVMVTWVS